MAAPPLDKTMLGTLKDMRDRLGLVERRLGTVPDRLTAGGAPVTDWNSAVEAGYYYSDTGALHTPVDDRFVGTVRVFGSGSLAGRVVQDLSIPTATVQTMVRTYRRELSGTTWSAWYLLPGGGGTTAHRDLLYGVPSTAAQRAALANAQVRHFNTDLGWEESYYAPTGTVGLTVLGLVASAAAGWYPTGLGPAIQLVPSATQSCAPGAMFTNWAAPGSGAAWRKGGAGFFTYAAGVITCVIACRINFQAGLAVQVGSGDTVPYVVRNNTTASPNVLAFAIQSLHVTYGRLVMLTGQNVPMAAGDTMRWTNQAGTATFGTGADSANRAAGEFSVQYVGPPLASV